MRRALAEQLRDEFQMNTPGTSSLDAIFAEQPPILTVFVGSSKYMSNPPLSPPQYEFVRHFEQVLYPATYIDMVEEWGPQWTPVRFVNELSAEWGKGGGKDFVCQMAFARVSNVLLCLKSPQAYFDMPHQTIIHMLNVAASSAQAHGVFFKPLRSLITRSPWFEDKFEGDVPGPQAKEIRFRNQIELISGHSSAETLEGKNLIAAIADEISAFPTADEVADSRTGRSAAKTSDGILEMLRSSATTRFPFTFKLAQISYPRFKGDAIQQATVVGREDIKDHGQASNYFVSGPIKTWDVNPRFDNIERVIVPGSEFPVPNVPSIVKDYRLNPAYARAKYECLPELSPNRYFKNDSAIFAAFAEVLDPSPLKITYRMGEEQEGEAIGHLQWQADFEINVLPVPGAIYAIHGDMAINGDRAGVALCHVSKWDESISMSDLTTEASFGERRPCVKVDFCTAFTSSASAQTEDGKVVPREVQLRWYRRLVVELTDRGFPVMFASFDNFQSADTMQILEARGLEVKRQSTDIDLVPWVTLRDVMYDGRLEGYHNPILMTELSALTRLKTGRLDHPQGGSKDMADALAGAVMGAIYLGGQEEEVPEYGGGSTWRPDEFGSEWSSGPNLIPDHMRGSSVQWGDNRQLTEAEAW